MRKRCLTMFNNYVACPACGKLHDDGGGHLYHGKLYFICLDCFEFLEEKEINARLEEYEQKNG